MLHPLQAPEVSSEELARALEAGDPVQLVDVRAPARVQTGHIDLGPDEQFHNIVGSKLIQHHTLDGTGIDPSVPIAVVCGHGNDSKVLALHLTGIGCDARSLAGGMSAWMKLSLPRELQTPPSLDRLVQFDRIGKGALGYLLISDGAALVVDPSRDTAAYLQVAADAGAEIVAVADTHVHADYISGAPALARELGIQYYLHQADSVYAYDGTPGRIEFRPLEDGGTISLGRCTVSAMHTPGHTEGSITYLVEDAVALTGDFVFINSIGRPDLAGKTGEWTEQLWESVQRAKSEWSPEMMIHPAHYASDAERRADRSIGESFGSICATNETLCFSEREDFVRWVSSQSASFPEAYKKIKAINVGLLEVDEAGADELEIGKNECALGGAG
jgi:glyoxylase-like metal-dependent hydrolase (beta-lactamase superfamily II)